MKGVAKFDFTAESEDELTVKVCVLEGANFRENYNLSSFLTQNETTTITRSFSPSGW